MGLWEYTKSAKRAPPMWALQGISFVEGSVIEIVTDHRLKKRQNDSLNSMNIREAENFTIFGDAVKKMKNGRSNVERQAINLMKKGERRMEYYMRTTIRQFIRR